MRPFDYRLGMGWKLGVWGLGGLAVIALGSALGCHRKHPRAGATAFPLAELRARFKTQVFAETMRVPAPEPPPALFERVHYAAPLGSNVAYVSPPKDGPRRPAIVWIAGGMDWGIGDEVWLPAGRENDQSARAFRDAGIVLMRPALRGSNDNPGRNECFLGEVADILAAAEYLAKRSDIDPARIYLGGHSTGGTLVLLTVESTSRFRAAFALGPVADPRQYGEGGCLPANVSGEEATLRAPVEFIDDIRTPTLIVDGQDGNAKSVRQLQKSLAEPAPIEFDIIPHATHFSAIAPITEALAQQILADRGPTPAFKLDVAAISARVEATR